MLYNRVMCIMMFYFLLQQLDEMWQELRWITDALQYARYKHPSGGVPITSLVNASKPESDQGAQKSDSASSTMDYLPTPSPSPELRRRKDVSGEENAHRERHTHCLGCPSKTMMTVLPLGTRIALSQLRIGVSLLYLICKIASSRC